MIKLINLSRTYKIKRAPSVKALKKVNLTLGEKGLVLSLVNQDAVNQLF